MDKKHNKIPDRKGDNNKISRMQFSRHYANAKDKTPFALLLFLLKVCIYLLYRNRYGYWLNYLVQLYSLLSPK